MSQRIRYSKIDETKLVSVKTFNHATNGARYKAVLDTAESQWIVVDDSSGLVAASGHQKSLHKMKIAVKSALTDLGITFTAEKRAARNALEEQAADAEQIDIRQ